MTPCHCDRKLRNFTQGKPISPVKQFTVKVFAEPTGPAIRYPIGTPRSRPAMIACAARRNRCFTPSCPDTMSSPNRDSTYSSSPKHSASMTAFFCSRSVAASSLVPRSSTDDRICRS